MRNPVKLSIVFKSKKKYPDWRNHVVNAWSRIRNREVFRDRDGKIVYLAINPIELDVLNRLQLRYEDRFGGGVMNFASLTHTNNEIGRIRLDADILRYTSRISADQIAKALNENMSCSLLLNEDYWTSLERLELDWCESLPIYISKQPEITEFI